MFSTMSSLLLRILDRSKHHVRSIILTATSILPVSKGVICGGIEGEPRGRADCWGDETFKSSANRTPEERLHNYRYDAKQRHVTLQSSMIQSSALEGNAKCLRIVANLAIGATLRTVCACFPLFFIPHPI